MSPPDFGMPTLLETPSLADCLALCRELSLSFVEINMNLPAFQAENLRPEELRALSQKTGFYFTLHLDENLDPFLFNRSVAMAYKETALRAIGTARTAKMPVVNLHMPSGVYFTLPDRREYLYEKYADRFLTEVESFRDDCVKAAGGVLLCVENTGGYLPFQRRAVDLLLERDTFALTLDIGHNHSAGGADLPFIEARRERLRHMHLHDAMGKRNHLPFGEGELNLESFLSMRRDCSCRGVLEIKTVGALRTTAAWLRAHGELPE